ncbi:hypothetical protein H7I41_04785 [Mycobacterium manitobense]|uniref:Uncharacterized protein n=1 Tax=[Mycobacterium] manitobense TaxID=190147 RepID=A0A9X2YKR2_9MYCO|nr:hypothetical protein [[Mycobacterium] manitobense]MCV7169240.1 hypothetical protein [[Mycobacterium] manitobense]
MILVPAVKAGSPPAPDRLYGSSLQLTDLSAETSVIGPPRSFAIGTVAMARELVAHCGDDRRQTVVAVRAV